MRRHLLRVFQRATIGEIRGDAHRPKRMITDRPVNCNRNRNGSVPDHSPGTWMPIASSALPVGVVGCDRRPVRILLGWWWMDRRREVIGPLAVSGALDQRPCRQS